MHRTPQAVFSGGNWAEIAMKGVFEAAVAHAIANPSLWPEEIEDVIKGGTFDPPPWNIVKGVVGQRGAPSGIISVDGIRQAQWGNTDRTDMVFSVTKSYLAVLAGIALDRGLIGSIDDRVLDTVQHSAFQGFRNPQITWKQLLQQTSEWQGELWSIPDFVDRDRQLSPTDDPRRFNRATPPRDPGTYWDYNDVRVNALCLALTIVFGRGLPDVLAECFPPFADRTRWSWSGYGCESAVEVDGERIEVVVGGGHWGGGLFSSTELDHSFGEMVLNGGCFGDNAIIQESTLRQLLTACTLQPVYGALWWLNSGQALYPAASEESVFASGVGMHCIWVDSPNRTVAAVHWIDEPAFPAFTERVTVAVKSRRPP